MTNIVSEARPAIRDLADEAGANVAAKTAIQGRSVWSRVKILIRRVHLYTGLFLLPWVFLYGVTGAMFNHQGLFPQVTAQAVRDGQAIASTMAEFPTAAEFAETVVESLQQSAGNDHTIKLAQDHGAEFTNDLMFEVNQSGLKHVVHIDPVKHASTVVTHPKNDERLEPVLDFHNIRLDPNPMSVARKAAAQSLADVGLKSNGPPQPFGWTKLNFLATVDDQPARITYVLKDGHVDATAFRGEDGMSLRQLLMRMHTSHGQPPHWNARMLWSLVVDVMAIAMVCWGLTGLFMWWQLKRTRLIGGAVLVLSFGVATLLYLGMHDFYAATKL